MTDTLTATQLRLPFTATLAEGFASVLPHASRDKITPQLCAARIDHRHVVATDKYTIGQYEHTTLEESVTRHGEEGPEDPDAAFTIPREIVAWLAKHKPGPGETLILTDDSATIVIGDRTIASQLFESLGGYNYPPVARIITDATNSETSILPQHLSVSILSRVAASAKVLKSAKEQPVRFQFAEPEGYVKWPAVRASIGRLVMMLLPTKPAA